ncbi:MAG: hypothetical protein WAK48_21310 [Candidatus Acidiferrum sp.]
MQSVSLSPQDSFLIKMSRMEKKPNRVTRKIVNDALRARGRDESLREGVGFFYFGGGEAVNWLTSSVMVKKISDLTLEQWLKEFDSLLERDKKLRRQIVAKKKGKKRE